MVIDKFGDILSRDVLTPVQSHKLNEEFSRKFKDSLKDMEL